MGPRASVSSSLLGVPLGVLTGESEHAAAGNGTEIGEIKLLESEDGEREMMPLLLLDSDALRGLEDACVDGAL